MTVTEDDVRHVARLARIRVPESELPQLATELNSILDWVAQLQEADVDSVAATASAEGASLRLRPDGALDRTSREDILANAPDARAGMFAIPKVVE